MNEGKDEKEEQEEFGSEDVKKLNSFYDMLINPSESNKFIEKYKNVLKEIFTLNSNQYIRISELYNNFTSESCGKFFFNSSIHKIEILIKAMIEIQLKNYELIISKGQLFYLIDDKLNKLQKIIQESSIKYKNINDNKNIFSETNTVFTAMMNTMNDIEIQTVDDYIWDKYKRHSEEANKKNVKDLVYVMKKLEKNIHDLVKAQNKQIFMKLRDPNDKFQKLYNEIEKYFMNYAENIKDMSINMDTELKNIDKENNSKSKKEDTKDSEQKSCLGLDEKDFYMIKYKIKILQSNKIALKYQENGEQKIIENQSQISNINSQKVNLFNLKFLLLTDKDKYEIISKLYNYNLKILDKSQYVLEEEKGKFNAQDLTNEILLYNKEDDIIQVQFKEKYNEILESINSKIVNNINNIEAFFFVMNNYRGNGNVKFTEKFYDLVVYIYDKAQDILIKASNKKVEDLMLILSRTYYKEKDKKKIYIVEAIKSHELYKDINFWKNTVTKQIEDEFKVKRNFNSKNQKSTNEITQKKKEDIIIAKLIPFADLLKDFGIEKDKVNDLIIQICDKYKFSEKSREQAFSFINQI